MVQGLAATRVPVQSTHLRAQETSLHVVRRLLLDPHMAHHYPPPVLNVYTLINPANLAHYLTHIINDDNKSNLSDT